QHAHNGGRAGTEPYGLSDHGRIAIQSGLPESIGEHCGASGVWAVVSHVQQATKHRMQTHHLEIRSADDTSADFARLAEADHGESDGGKVSKGGERFDTRAQVLDFRHRERHVIRADPWRTLANIDQAALVAVDDRTKEHAA